MQAALDLKKRKLASEWLVKFYHANPKRLDKLMRQLVNQAEKPKNMRAIELILNLLEGPAKETGSGDTYNFNFLSEGERLRAQDSVKRMIAMRSEPLFLPEKKDEQSTQLAGNENDDGGDRANGTE